MICATCLALEFAPEDQLRHLVVWQARRIHRLTGGCDEADLLEPTIDDELPDDEPATPAPDLLPVLESVLSFEDVYRKPARVAAPKLLHHLRQAGWTLTYGDDQ